MILVNNPGDWGAIYFPFKHAAWHGLTLADLVFPFFLFVMGFSSYLSLYNRQPNRQLFYKIVKRTVLLFLLGLFLNWIPDFSISTIRVPGILQRISFVYFFTAISIVYIPNYIFHLSIFILLAYYFILLFIPVPNLGHPSIVIGVNIPAYIDNLLLNGHLWKYTKTWDPEGILSGVSAIVSALLGVQYAKLFFRSLAHVNQLFYHSIVLLVVGYLWSFQYPINKSLWTGSYILVTTGYAILIFLTIEFLHRKKIVKEGVPFIYFGANALGAYFLSSLFAKFMSIKLILHSEKWISTQTYLYSLYKPFFDPYLSSLVWASANVLLWIPIFYYLYKKNRYIKI